MLGRNYKIGIGKESVRGTAVAPSVWVPALEFSHDEKREYLKDESAVGVIADSIGMDLAYLSAEGELRGIVTDKAIGLLLYGSLGSVTSGLHAGETIVYDHAFALDNTNIHQSLTLEMKNDNEQLAFALAVIKSLKLTAEVGKYAEFQAAFESKKGAAAANSPSYTAENKFIFKHASLKLATNLAGLAAASAINVKSVELSIDKNTEKSFAIGSTDPANIFNREITVEGNIEAEYADVATFKALFTAGTQKAMRIQLVNSDVTLGNASNPTITIDMPKVYCEDWSRSTGLGEIVKQTIKFKAVYSLSDSKLINITLTNLQASY